MRVFSVRRLIRTSATLPLLVSERRLICDLRFPSCFLLFTGFFPIPAPLAAFRVTVSLAVPALLHALLATSIGLSTGRLQDVRRKRRSSGSADEDVMQAVPARPSFHPSGMLRPERVPVTASRTQLKWSLLGGGWLSSIRCLAAREGKAADDSHRSNNHSVQHSSAC